MNVKTCGLLLALGWLGVVAAYGGDVLYGSVRNGSFGGSRSLRPDDPNLAAIIKAKWTVPADLVFPADWGPNPNTPGGSFEYIRNGGWKEGAFVRLDGGGHLASYFGNLEPGKPYVGALRVRGTGTVYFGAYEYGEDGQVGGATMVERPVATTKWLEYRGVYEHKNPQAICVNLWVAGKGPVEVTEVQFMPADPVTAAMTRERVKLYGSGLLLEDPEVLAIRVDAAYQARLAEYDAVLAKLRTSPAQVTPDFLASVHAKATALDPYLHGKDKTQVLADYHNEMVLLARVLKEAKGTDAGPVEAVKVEAVSSGAGYKPGERAARPGAVTVTDVRSNKVRYNENETAATVATIVNQTGTALPVTVVANMIIGLDEARELARGPMTLQPGENKWPFNYSVGPETYGRAIEVQCLNAKGELLDRWQEYYAVAAEWFRVQQHVGAAFAKNYKTDNWVTYYNQVHYFANEPTDFGVHAGDFEEYLSPQVGYHLNMPAKKAQIAYYKSIGAMATIYQNCSYSGHMGYDMIRQHPEFALYDANGQLAVDPVYGGVPNPMEIASPIEIGPKRQVRKPYLDRKITPWGHGAVNTARQEVIEFEANSVKEYAKILGFDGVYTDGNWGIQNGYGYDGKPNVATSDAAEYMRLNARNHRVFSAILKQDDPNFGTWYNWAYNYCDYMLNLGQKSYLGSGVKGDVGDDTVRAAAVRNTMFLLEIQDTFSKSDSRWTFPVYHLNMLADNRDQMMQKYGCNMIVGYLFPWREPENPGANRWGWPTLNYFGAQLIATQHHLAGGFVPSMRPWLQFATRYSRYVWAPEVKVVADPEQVVRVTSPEELWWKRLVYKLPTDQGYDLIVHLVRIPPMKKWDIDWLDEPVPLTAVSLRATLGKAQLRDAWMIRPYDFDEPQQPVQEKMAAVVKKGQATVTVPSFRYHAMLVFRVTENHK